MAVDAHEHAHMWIGLVLQIAPRRELLQRVDREPFEVIPGRGPFLKEIADPGMRTQSVLKGRFVDEAANEKQDARGERKFQRGFACVVHANRFGMDCKGWDYLNSAW